MIRGKNDIYVAPRRGAWIETSGTTTIEYLQLESRPAGARGLKQGNLDRHRARAGVAPRRGAWIETPIMDIHAPGQTVAPRRGAWIETTQSDYICPLQSVAPRRGAWIETIYLACVIAPSKSRPAGARGLKPFPVLNTPGP